jgi:hypothetical protein
MLDRSKYGFIPEVAHYKTNYMDDRGKYLKYWFAYDLDVDTVTRRDQMIIGLHNSWTPKWYKELSEKQVLENDCLLSKTLRHILCDP